MNTKNLFKSILTLGLLVSIVACKSDDDNTNDDDNNNDSIEFDVTGSCDDLDIINFNITNIETIPPVHDPYEYYEIYYSFDVINNGSETITIDGGRITVQSYLSTDNVLSNDDQSAAGIVRPLSSIASGETITDIEWLANSVGFDEDALEIDGYYLLVEVEFYYNDDTCSMVISHQLDLE